jgi:hypothetical protein
MKRTIVGFADTLEMLDFLLQVLNFLAEFKNLLAGRTAQQFTVEFCL